VKPYDEKEEKKQGERIVKDALAVAAAAAASTTPAPKQQLDDESIHFDCQEKMDYYDEFTKSLEKQLIEANKQVMKEKGYSYNNIMRAMKKIKKIRQETRKDQKRKDNIIKNFREKAELYEEILLMKNESSSSSNNTNTTTTTINNILIRAVKQQHQYKDQVRLLKDNIEEMQENIKLYKKKEKAMQTILRNTACNEELLNSNEDLVIDNRDLLRQNNKLRKKNIHLKKRYQDIFNSYMKECIKSEELKMMYNDAKFSLDNAKNLSLPPLSSS
jgi:hypothetical protein